ncbi:MAG: insulinase family protein [Bacteroidales bacterium]|nr:insulinase family protein [Bacteroidales bacterium]
MLEYKRHILKNGLRVVACQMADTSMATFNLLYNVGSKNENPQRTGLAHLMEHLMFTGSENVKNLDDEVQNAGGENNAFTNEDITNYYIMLPAKNIETAFWIDSDRMRGLTLSEESIEVQRKVVMEEFKERHLNVPYGDIAHLRGDQIFKVHPYRWPTIGLDLSHIENATREEIVEFYRAHYAPDNAVLTVVGGVDADHVFELAEKWFGDIDAKAIKRELPVEPEQTEQRVLSVERDVPASVIALSYHMGSRMSREFNVLDLATDVLADGASSRLVKALTKDNPIMSEADAGVDSTHEPGVLSFSGTLLPGVSMEEAENGIRNVVKELISDGISDYDLQKIKNRRESKTVLKQLSGQVLARTLAEYEVLGDVDLINKEPEILNSISGEEMCSTLAHTIRKENESILYYSAAGEKK